MPEDRFASTFNKAVNIELNKIPPGTEEKQLSRHGIKSSLNNSDEKDKSLIS